MRWFCLICEWASFQTGRSTNEEIAWVLVPPAWKKSTSEEAFCRRGLNCAGQEKGGSYQKRRMTLGHRMSCSEPPEGFSVVFAVAGGQKWLSWTIDGISHERMVRRVWKRNQKPWRQQGWIIPPDQNSSFVANMEKVLDVYKRPLDPLYRIVSAWTITQAADWKTGNQSRSPGQPAEHDYENITGVAL